MLCDKIFTQQIYAKCSNSLSKVILEVAGLELPISLMLSMMSKHFSRQHFEIFFFFFPRK